MVEGGDRLPRAGVRRLSTSAATEEYGLLPSWIGDAVLVAILVDRLGGRVEITADEVIRQRGRIMRWDRRDDAAVVYETAP